MRRTLPSWRRFAIAAACACACDPESDDSRPFDDVLPVPDDAPEPRGAPVLGTITPVLLVPNDRTVDQARIDAVNAGLADLLSWYQTQLVTHRLEMGELQVISGSLSAAEYRENDGIWKLGPDELRAKLGFSPWDEGHLVLLVGAGLRGWAGGNANETGTAGFAVLGLESLTDPSDCEPGVEPPWWCNPTVWRGTAIHELGHALTLPHSEMPSIMKDHTDFWNRGLLDDDWWAEKWKVRYGSFARNVPNGGGDPSGGDPSGGGEPPPNNDWQGCSSDGDCTSGLCGCNGGSEMLCLPNQEYPKDCA